MIPNAITRFPQFPVFKTLKQCTQVHAYMIITGLILNPQNPKKLLLFLTDPDHGNLHYARLVFRRISNPSLFLWNTFIKGCYKNHAAREAIDLYREMRRSNMSLDMHTFQFLFKACARAVAEREGMEIHGLMDDALRVFDEMPDKNVVSWASMVAGYAQCGRGQEAVRFFSEMILVGVKPDSVLFVSVLSACALLGNLRMGKLVHGFLEREGIEMTNNLAVALINLYTKCGDFVASRQAFDRMPQKVLAAWNVMVDGYCKFGDIRSASLLFEQMAERDILSYNSMIIGYMQSNQLDKVFSLFEEIKAFGLKPDKFTIASLLTACANSGSVQRGKSLHAYIEEHSIERDIFLDTALLDMYAKCGRIDQALHVFQGMREKDVMAWTAMISGLAMHGHGRPALDIFSKMQSSGIKPNDITLIGVLSACSHTGLVKKGKYHFNQMPFLYNLTPKIEHYGCMVDLLGRAGLFKEVEELIETMPMKPNGVIWGSVLGACRVHNHVSLAEKAANHLLVLEPEKDAVYVLLYNIYASGARWVDAINVRKIMEERGVQKIAGLSSITVDGTVHEFVAGDRSHPQFEELEAEMRAMAIKLREVGYAPKVLQVALDIDEEEKEGALFGHSEKMAVAFGLIRLSPDEPIIVMKNLRVCEDCHLVIKLVAGIYEREIIVRDRTRFHHFRDGNCSCMGYW
ncbi:pentatricopeptide repeat-containing protein At5g66520-like [Amborella trichopoda]|uniref:pentatricopeptide repeat-containing protein At5g66520-like n=1 Tax=Amborella trichopoda TaxID=13333 RepID=UPI0009BD1071|nr:pentatricopeptide repeat-containing protein At5g66520-like [Amborella trichopoda]|eukprot:XP_020519876.1 pentatricopeptide repeat-containing protein At5g66520-like [Amborella trichopoda]